MNYLLLGPPGSGKTRIANVLSFVFYKSGIISYEKPIIASQSDFLGRLVGDASAKTLKTMKESLERVIFIDEAYALADCLATGELNTVGSTAGASKQDLITEMINFMDKNIGLYISIFAGYEYIMMNCFMKMNQGLSRRIPNIIILKNYTPDELTKILIENLLLTMQGSGKTLNQKIYNYLFTTINFFEKYFPSAIENQAGDMVNLSNEITKAIFSSYMYWENDNFENNKMFIDEAVISFLHNKGIDLFE